ncbi:unnamed protein product, partial [Adineta steineri]
QIKSKLTKWKQYGIINAGPHNEGNQLNQLSDLREIFIDCYTNIFIADFGDGRIVD